MLNMSNIKKIKFVFFVLQHMEQYLNHTNILTSCEKNTLALNLEDA